MTNEDYVTYETAQALARCGYDGRYDYMYATENFCYGNNPISFDAISVGERISEYVAYYVNDDNEDAYRGIPCPTLWQAQKWLREIVGIHAGVTPAIQIRKWQFYLDDLNQHINPHDGELLTRCTEDMQDEYDKEYFDTYESALSAGIEAALKLITDKIEDDEEKNIG